MYDLAYFRSHLEEIAARLAPRGFTLEVASFGDLDAQRRAALTEAEQKKAERNAGSAEIAKLRKQGVDTGERQKSVRELGARIDELDRKAKALDDAYRDLLSRVPNTPHESVQAGAEAAQNAEVRRVGEPPRFDFAPKPHWDLGAELGILDLERAAKITGARFAVYWDLGARLERALINFMLDLHTREHGYREVLPPFLIHSASLYGTAQLPKFGEDLFRIADHDLWLTPTAEVPLTNLFREETLDGDTLPISLCAYTPCFRSEAGSHGRDVRGIIRQHQFQKVELVKITRPDQSYQALERLTADAERVLQKLGLPYRTMALCTGEMGFASAKTYDIEVWLPSHGEYREISSCSNCEAFQARRAAIRWKPAKGGKADYVHTLNGSGLAVGRTWVAILENYQQADGGVLIPEALVPYVGAERIAPRAGIV